MATDGLPLTSTPVNVVSDRSLTVGEWYTVQNRSDRHGVHMVEAADAPSDIEDDDLDDVYIQPLGFWEIRPETGLGWWAWVDEGGARLTVQESS